MNLDNIILVPTPEKGLWQMQELGEEKNEQTQEQ
jgi:hypothetical protein